MKVNTHISLAALSFLLFACGGNDKKFDASGSFEAEETIISAEATGTILQFDLEEGQELSEGTFVGYIDSTQLHLKKLQLEQQIASMLSKRPNISLQLAALETQLASAQKEKERLTRLVEGNAAPAKQLDDVNTQIDVLLKQISALNSSLSITSNGITNDANSLKIQIAQLEDQLKRCRIVNPVNGTVLTTYVRKSELAAAGKPLYKIADLSELTLRAYITGNQLAKIKLNQHVKVMTDDGEGNMKEGKGIVEWISNKAEFTPKTIQTKDERANLVYAVKIRVKNDGSYKIGMYGEIKF